MPETQVVAALEKNKYYTHQDLFYVNRHSFWTAGQDSWTLPPAQDNDAFIQLLNVEPVLQGVLQRRRGYTFFSPGTSVTTAVTLPTLAANSGGGTAWSNPNNALVLDGAVATVSLSSGGSTQHLQLTGFGFSIPNGTTVTNVTVTVTSSQASLASQQGLGMFLISGGILVAGTQFFFPNTTTLGTQTLNFSNLTPAQVNASTFGVDISTFFPLGQHSNTFGVDAVTVTVTYSFLSPYTLAYSFRSELLGLREVVFTSPNNVLVTTESGGQYIPSLFTPSQGATRPRMVLSRSFGYFADGVAADYKKWDGSTSAGNLTKWGIAIGGTPIATFGPKAPATAVDLPSNINGAGTAWFNPTNIQGQPPGSNVASVILQGGTAPNSDYLRATGYGFALPSTAVIGGIVVSITGSETITTGPGSLLTAQLVKNGVPVGNAYTAAMPATSSTFSLGSITDTWGTPFLFTDINASNFGVQIYITKGGATGSFSTENIVSITVTVNSVGNALAFTTNTATTNVVLLNGRTYFYAFQNSTTGHTSGLSPASFSTGPLGGNQVNITGIPVPTDPQVTTVLILGTADGNDQTTLYQVGSVPAGTTTFSDTISDAVLQTQGLYQYTDIFGQLHGIANNNPPPAITFPVKHKGRIYGSIGQTLYFSKNLNDVTTSGGLITGKYEEAWPATNQFDISEFAESIVGLLSDGETLWIATERCIRRLVGDSPNNFQIPEVQFNEVGLLNQDSWKVTFYEGQPVGTLWLTPDFRVMASDFNTYTDVGTPIQDVLNSINTSAVSSIHAQYVSKGPADYYMLYVPTGSNTSPDTVCIFNLRSKKWFIWQPTDQATCSLFFFDVLGLPRWLFATAAGPIYEWSSGLFQDRIGNGPVSYPVTITTSWLDMGDYNIRKFVNQIVPTTADQTGLTIQVDGASNELDFNAPLSVVPPTVVSPAAIPTDVFVPLASGPSHNRAFRFIFVSPPSTIQNVLTGFAIEAGQFHRY